MWRPSSSLSSSVHHSSVWGGEDAAAARERDHYARLQAAIDAAQGRPPQPFLRAEAPVAAAQAVHRYVLQQAAATRPSADDDEEGERYRSGKVLLPSRHILAATAPVPVDATATGGGGEGGSDAEADPASLLGGAAIEFDLQRARERRRSASANPDEHARRAALRAARARRGEAAAGVAAATASGASRPGSSPHAGLYATPQPSARSHSVMLMRGGGGGGGGQMMHSPPPTAPPTMLYAGMGPFSPVGPAPVAFTPPPLTPSSHHFAGSPLSAHPASHVEDVAPAPMSPPLSPRMHGDLAGSARPQPSRLMHLALSPCASPAEAAALIRRLKQPVRLGIYEQRFEGKVEQVIGAKDQRALEAAEARARVAAQAAMQLAAERAAKAVPGPYNKEEEEAKQITDAELYYRVSTMQMQTARTHTHAHSATDPSTTPRAAPRPPASSRPASGGRSTSHTKRRHSATSVTPRLHTSGSSARTAGPARPATGSSVRPTPLKTQMQVFQHDLHAAHTPRGAHDSAAMEARGTGVVSTKHRGSKAIRSVDLSHAAASSSLAPSPSPCSLVSPLTSTAHWSNRVYTHGGVAGAATTAPVGPQGVPAALVSPRLQATRAATTLHAQQLAHKFHAFHRTVKQGLAGPDAVPASSTTAPTTTDRIAGSADTSTVAPTAASAAAAAAPTAGSDPADGVPSSASASPSALPPSGARRARKGDAEDSLLSSLGALEDAAFNDLITHTRFQSYSASFQASLVHQRLELLRADVERQGSVPGLHDQLAKMKAAWIAESQKRARAERHERDVMLRKHWKTGRIVRDDNTVDEKEEEPTAGATGGEMEGTEEEHALQERKQRHVELYLAAARREADQLERERLERQEQDPHRQVVSNAAAAAAAAVTAAALEVEYAEGSRLRPSDQAAAHAHASSNSGALDASLRRAVGTEAFLKQKLGDTVVVAQAASIRDEYVAARQNRAAQRAQARRVRHEARALRRRRREAGSDVETSTSGESESDQDESDSETAAQRLEQSTIAPALLAPIPAAAAAAHHAEAVAALEPVTALLSLHAAHERATSTLDATDASMRLQARLATEAHASLSASRAVELEAQEVARRRKEMAALLRLENNQRAIQTTHRKMKRTGTLELALLGLVHAVGAAPSPASGGGAGAGGGARAQKQSGDIWSLVPRGHVARFEVRLVYASTDLPQLVAHTMPFSASVAASACGVTQLLQRVMFPIHNAQVQRVVVTLQAPSPKQLLTWLFHNRHALFGPAAGLDHSTNDSAFDVATLAVGTASKYASRPNIAEYLRWCDPDLTAVSARGPQTWTPPASYGLLGSGGSGGGSGDVTSKLLTSDSTRASSPRASHSKQVVPYGMSQSDAKRTVPAKRVGSAPLHGRKASKASAGGDSRAEEDDDEMAAYRRSLTGWFSQGGPNSTSAASSAPASDAVAPLSHRARVVQAHVASAPETDTLGGWLQALRIKLAGARLGAPGPAAHAEPSSNGGQSGHRMQAIGRWSAEQVAMWFSDIGLADPSPLFQRRPVDGAALLAAADDVARIAKRGEKRERHGREDESGAIAAMMDHAATDSPAAAAATGIVGKDGRPPTPEHVLQAGNKQRTAVAVHLTRALALLTHARPVKISQHFPLTDLVALRSRVLASFERVCALPAYVAAETARREQLESEATTAELSAEETAQLSQRLTTHNQREAERLAARHAPRAIEAPRQRPVSAAATATVASLAEQAAKKSKATATKSLLHSQLQPMTPVGAAMAHAYRARRGIAATQPSSGDAPRSDEANGDGVRGATDDRSASPSDEDDEGAHAHTSAPALAVHDGRSIISRESSPTRASSSTPHGGGGAVTSAVAMFQSRPSTPTTIATRAPSVAASASVAATPRLQSSNVGVLLLGCFELSLRTIARAPDGVLRGAMVLRPGRVVASAHVHSAAASGAGLSGAVPLEAGPRSDAHPSGARCRSAGPSSRAHYRTDMTTSMHSASPRTFLAPSSVPSTLPPTPQRAPSAMPAVPTPATTLMQSVGSTPSGAAGVGGSSGGSGVASGGAPAYSWLRRSMREALSADASREAGAWLSNARVDIEARFVPTFDPLHDIQ